MIRVALRVTRAGTLFPYTTLFRSGWQDEAVVLAARPHGETAVIAELWTRGLGRHAGLVRGGQSARLGGVYQSGNLVAATWSGRLPEHLGTLECEQIGREHV